VFQDNKVAVEGVVVGTGVRAAVIVVSGEEDSAIGGGEDRAAKGEEELNAVMGFAQAALRAGKAVGGVNGDRGSEGKGDGEGEGKLEIGDWRSEISGRGYWILDTGYRGLGEG
jgi:hypothetical protein